MATPTKNKNKDEIIEELMKRINEISDNKQNIHILNWRLGIAASVIGLLLTTCGALIINTYNDLRTEIKTNAALIERMHTHESAAEKTIIINQKNIQTNQENIENNQKDIKETQQSIKIMQSELAYKMNGLDKTFSQIAVKLNDDYLQKLIFNEICKYHASNDKESYKIQSHLN